MRATLSGDNRLPRYQRLAETLRDAVARYGWRPGERLPSEQELAAQYDVAPGTVRQAITQLVDEGLLERYQGKGTFVRKPSFDNSLFRFFRFHGATDDWSIPESRILSRKTMPAPAAISSVLGLSPRTRVIFMSRLRLLVSEPVLAEEIWLPLNRFRKFFELQEAEIGPLLYPIYEAVCGEIVARAEEQLTAEACSTEHARMLRMKAGNPVIVIDRTAYGFDETPLEWRRSRGRADKFQYHVEIR